MRFFTRYFPNLIGLIIGFGVIIVGAATQRDVSNDWLAFSGSLLGSAVAALVGFWLVNLQEDRAASAKIDQVRQTMVFVRKAVERLRTSGRYVSSFTERVNAIADYRIATKAVRVVSSNFGVTNVSTMVALEELATELESVEEHELSVWMRTREGFVPSVDGRKLSKDESVHTLLADAMIDLVNSVEATLD